MSLDLTGIGLTVDDLNLDIDADDLPLSLPDYRPRYRPRQHWETTEAEEYHLDLPPFNSHADRARWFITEMARQALANGLQGATEDDEVLPYSNRLVSLTDLLRSVDEPVIGHLPKIGIK